MGIIRTLLLLVLLSSLFSKYEVGEICEDIIWTDNSGMETSIHSEVAKGKAVFIFWGSSG